MNAQGQKYARERLMFRYVNALERGDLETVGVILEQAEQDAELERMILEVNDFYVSEQQEMIDERDAAFVRKMILQHLPSADSELSEGELPPLTVADVLARISSDAALKRQLEREPASALMQLQHVTQALPTNLTLTNVRVLFGQWGIRVSASFEKLFRETAIFLSLGHEQTRAQLAATRRQRQKRRGQTLANESKGGSEKDE